MASKIKRIPHKNLMKFIKVEPSGVLKVHFDLLCQYLFQIERRKFMPSKFEKMFNDEVSKLRGYVIDQAALTKICDYIDDLSLYLTKERLDTETGRIDLQMRRFQQAHPKEYELARQRALGALEKAKRMNPAMYQKMVLRYQRRYGELPKS